MTAQIEKTSTFEAYTNHRSRCFPTVSGMPGVSLPRSALGRKLLRPAAGPLLLPKVMQMAKSCPSRRCLQLSQGSQNRCNYGSPSILRVGMLPILKLLGSV